MSGEKPLPQSIDVFDPVFPSRANFLRAIPPRLDKQDCRLVELEFLRQTADHAPLAAGKLVRFAEIGKQSPRRMFVAFALCRKIGRYGP